MLALRPPGVFSGAPDAPPRPRLTSRARWGAQVEETSFVEVSEGEDPLVECQTVCKFVRPNQMTVIEQAALQQQQQQAKEEAERMREAAAEEAEGETA